jgi:hypothetical protein
MMAFRKCCPRCGHSRTLENFYACASRADGLSAYCRRCCLRIAEARARDARRVCGPVPDREDTPARQIELSARILEARRLKRMCGGRTIPREWLDSLSGPRGETGGR